MKFEEFRHAIPSNDVTPLPKSEAKPCFRGMMDKAHYDLTGEIKMVEEFKVYVPPVVTEAEAAAQKLVRRRPLIMSNKPSCDQLEIYLRNGMSFAEIAVKQGTSVATVGNWIRSYGLQGIKGQKSPKVESVAQYAPLTTDMVQESPTLAEIEQFHTDSPVQELPVVEMGVSGMSDEEFDRIMATVEVVLVDPSCEPIIAEPDPVNLGACEEVLQGVLEDLKSVRRVYLSEAGKAFDERFRALCAEVCR
jgi:hypothetical protein